jgi:hypothetical protein
MGENRCQRAGLIAQLASLVPPPESVPINNLVQVEGTPLHGTEPLDPFEFVRTIAAARIAMPKSYVRLSAGRQELGEGIQALCFFAGGELDLLWRQAPHHGQPGGGRRPRAHGPPGDRAAAHGHARTLDVVCRFPIPSGEPMAWRLASAPARGRRARRVFQH